MKASRRGYLNIVKFLYNKKDVNANIKNNDNETALDRALNSKQFEVAKYFIKNKFDMSNITIIDNDYTQ